MTSGGGLAVAKPTAGTPNSSPAKSDGGASPAARSRSHSRQAMPQAKHLRPFDTAAIKVLLLENVNQAAVDALKREGYQVEHHAKALADDVLKEKIAEVHVIGIRCAGRGMPSASTAMTLFPS